MRRWLAATGRQKQLRRRARRRGDESGSVSERSRQSIRLLSETMPRGIDRAELRKSPRATAPANHLVKASGTFNTGNELNCNYVTARELSCCLARDPFAIPHFGLVWNPLALTAVRTVPTQVPQESTRPVTTTFCSSMSFDGRAEPGAG